jgi:hypothetical protein
MLIKTRKIENWLYWRYTPGKSTKRKRRNVNRK